jgi:hypothetical protein
MWPPDWKEISNTLLPDGLLLYIENIKEITRKLLGLINEFITVTGYKVSIKNHLHFYSFAMKTQK